MMFGSENDVQSTWGLKIKGSASSGLTLKFILLSRVMVNGWLQWAQTVSMVTEMVSFRSLPCTKGVAMASTAQAAWGLSPVLKVNLWGVVSAVTGKAQVTAPLLPRTRKKRFFSRSSRMAVTFACGMSSFAEIPPAETGLWVRAISSTTRFRTR